MAENSSSPKKDLPWFRAYAEFAHDPKVQMMSESDQRRLTMLFHLRCGGLISPTDEEIIFLLRIEADTWLETKALFIEKGFIDENNRLCNWEKRQYESDSSTARVQKHREKQKQPKGNGDETLQKRFETVTVTPPDTDTDTDTEADTESEKDSPHPPSPGGEVNVVDPSLIPHEPGDGLPSLPPGLLDAIRAAYERILVPCVTAACQEISCVP